MVVFILLVCSYKVEDSYSDAPGFLTENIIKELDPKIPVMHVFAIEFKNKNTMRYYECPVYYITAYS